MVWKRHRPMIKFLGRRLNALKPPETVDTRHFLYLSHRLPSLPVSTSDFLSAVLLPLNLSLTTVFRTPLSLPELPDVPAVLLDQSHIQAREDAVDLSGLTRGQRIIFSIYPDVWRPVSGPLFGERQIVAKEMVLDLVLAKEDMGVHELLKQAFKDPSKFMEGRKQ